MVCLQHVPDEVAEEITLSLKMGTVEGRLDHDGAVYTWHLEQAEAFDTDHCPIYPLGAGGPVPLCPGA